MSKNLRSLSELSAIAGYLNTKNANTLVEGEKLKIERLKLSEIIGLLDIYFFGFCRMNHGDNGCDFADFSNDGGYTTLCFEETGNKIILAVSWTSWKPS
jgi:hypothetical protein